MKKTPEKIGILFLIDRLDFGGAERHLERLVLTLDRSRFDPVVCCLNNKDGVGTRLEGRGVPVVNLGLSKIYGAPALQAARRLHRLAWKHRVRIVQTYLNSASVFGPLALLPCRFRGVRFILSRRDDGFELSPPMAALLRFVLRHSAHRIVSVSERIRREMAVKWKIPARKIYTVHNGIEPPELDAQRTANVRREMRERLGLAEENRLIGAVGSLKPVKGFDLLIRAFALIRADIPGAHLVIVGGGPEARRLKALARSLNVERFCRFPGYSEAVERWFPAFDLYVSTSLTEGVSNSLLEAMAFARPVLATAVGGTPEVVIDGQSGLLLRSRRPEELAERAVQLLRNEALSARLGENARRRIEKRFSLKHMVSQYQRIYQELLQEAGLS